MASDSSPTSGTCLDRLRDGDEDAFGALIDRHYASMRRLAGMFVDSDAAAEEIVQQTWVAVIDGLDGFEGRSSVKTWIFAILTNQAKTRARKDARTKPWSSLFDVQIQDHVSSDADRFDGSGHWKSPPKRWALDPEEQLTRRTLLEVVQQTLETLPPSQRSVVWLRDVEGLGSADVCRVLDISAGNQRVLLHRGRVKLRRAIRDSSEVS